MAVRTQLNAVQMELNKNCKIMDEFLTILTFLEMRVSHEPLRRIS